MGSGFPGAARESRESQTVRRGRLPRRRSAAALWRAEHDPLHVAEGAARRRHPAGPVRRRTLCLDAVGLGGFRNHAGRPTRELRSAMAGKRAPRFEPCVPLRPQQPSRSNGRRHTASDHWCKTRPPLTITELHTPPMGSPKGRSRTCSGARQGRWLLPAAWCARPPQRLHHQKQRLVCAEAHLRL